MGLENRKGEFTNLHRFGAGWSVTPVEDLELCFDYNILFADKNGLDDVQMNKSQNGCLRGQLVSAVAKYKVNDHWTVEAGGNVFLGESDSTFFGQFEGNTNIYAAARWSF